MNKPDEIEWHKPDWTREEPRRFWDPSRKLLGSIRDYQRVHHRRGPFFYLIKKCCKFRHRLWSIVTGAEIDLHCQIGGGLLIPHPNGVVIHPESVIGPNCLIFQQVTLAGPCKLGFHVDIGAGAKLLGPMTIGDNVRIGANAVVTKNVESGLTVAGIPARPSSVLRHAEWLPTANKEETPQNSTAD